MENFRSGAKGKENKPKMTAVKRVQMKPTLSNKNSLDKIGIQIRSTLGDTKVITSIDLDAALESLHCEKHEMKKYASTVTGWYTILLSKCAGVEVGTILTALKYVVVPLKLELYGFLRSTEDNGEYVQFFVDNRLLGNRLKRLKSKVFVLYTIKPIDLSVREGLPTEDVTLNPQLITAIKAALRSRYDEEEHVLDLVYFHKAEELCDNFCSIYYVNVLHYILELLPKEFPHIKVLSLRDNFLTTLRAFELFVVNFPNLELLDLRNNSIDQLDELKFLDKWPINSIKLTGNIVDKEKLNSMFRLLPLVNTIDGFHRQSFSTEFKIKNTADPQAVRFITNFVTNYFTNFDNADRKLRNQLKSLYGEKALFSLTTTLTSSHGYQLYNRNHKAKKQMSTFARTSKVQIGIDKVIHALRLLPVTKHKYESMSMDLHLSTDIKQIFCISGSLKEIDGDKVTDRNFARMFILCLQNSRWKITNDMLTIFKQHKSQPHPNKLIMDGLNEISNAMPMLQIDSRSKLKDKGTITKSTSNAGHGLFDAPALAKPKLNNGYWPQASQHKTNFNQDQLTVHDLLTSSAMPASIDERTKLLISHPVPTTVIEWPEADNVFHEEFNSDSENELKIDEDN